MKLISITPDKAINYDKVVCVRAIEDNQTAIDLVGEVTVTVPMSIDRVVDFLTKVEKEIKPKVVRNFMEWAG